MKTVIFFSQRRLEYHNFDRLSEDIRLIAVFTEEYYSIFPKEKLKYFSAVHIVPKEKNPIKIPDYLLSLPDVEKIIEKEIKQIDNINQLHLFSSDELGVSLCGYLRDKYHLPGATLKDVLCYRDKVLMKKKLEQCKMRVPKFVDLDINKAKKSITQYYDDIVSQLGKPFIIKPVDSEGGKATTKVNTLEAMKRYVDQISSDKTKYEVEEFISGKLYHCDMLISKKKPILVISGEYLHPILEFTRGKLISTLPLPKDNPTHSAIKEFAINTVNCLGNFDGSRHLEVFVTDKNDIVFLEIAARPSGGLVMPSYEKNFNISFLDLALMIELGESIPSIDPEFINYWLWGYLPIRAAKNKALFKPTLKGDIQIYWRELEPEAMLSRSKSILDVSGHFYINEKNYDDMKRDFETLKKINFNDG